MTQERKKRRIVLASILKPVDDTRMFEKMAASLSRDERNEVFIIGFPTYKVIAPSNIQLLPLNAFSRLSIGRILAKWKVLSMARTLRPDVLIFTTHELLIPAIFLKIISPVRIIYDVRENYFRNILHSGSFPWFIRWPLAMWVRWKEKLLAPMVDHFFLAEKGYEQELRFFRGGWTVIENKAVVNNKIKGSRIVGGMKLLFSGTLSRSTGVFEAIKLAKKLHALDSTVALNIIGYAAITNERKLIENTVSGFNFIKIIGGDQLVPHDVIMEEIRNSNFAILSYPDSRHTRNSHPTKLFEYLACQLPVILSRHWPWVERYASHNAFVYFDFTHPDYPGLLAQLRTKTPFSSVPEDVSWESEESKLIDAVNKI